MKGWKTLLFNIGVLAIASPDLMALVPPRAALYITIGGNILLRAITDSPMVGMKSTKKVGDGPKSPNFPVTR